MAQDDVGDAARSPGGARDRGQLEKKVDCLGRADPTGEL
jgi:hypothetical protein